MEAKAILPSWSIAEAKAKVEAEKKAKVELDKKENKRRRGRKNVE